MSETNFDLKNIREGQLVMLRILKQVDRICRDNNIPYWLDSGTLLGAVRHRGFIPWDDDLDISMMREDYERFLKVAPEALQPEAFLQNIYTDKYCLHNFVKIRDNNSLFITNEEQTQDVHYHQGIFIDVFPMDKLSPRGWVRHFWRRVFFKRLYEACSLAVKYSQRNIKKPFCRYLIKNCLTVINKKCLLKVNFPNKRVAAAIEKILRRFVTIQSTDPERFVVAYGLGLPFREVYRYDGIFPLKEMVFEDGTFYAPNDCDSYLRALYGDTYMQLPKKENRKPGHGARIITDLKKAKA